MVEHKNLIRVNSKLICYHATILLKPIFDRYQLLLRAVLTRDVFICSHSNFYHSYLNNLILNYQLTSKLTSDSADGHESKSERCYHSPNL